MREAADAELEELFGGPAFTRDIPAPRELELLTDDEWTDLTLRLAVAIHRVVEDARGFLSGDLVNITLAPRGGSPTSALRVNLWRFR